MVTENTDIAGAAPPADSPVDVGTGDVGIETGQPVADISAPPIDDSIPPPSGVGIAPAQDIAPAADAAAPVSPAQPQYTPEQIARMQQESVQYAQVQQRAALQNQADQYKKQLEDQGYMPEQAEQLSGQYMQSQQAQQDLVQQAEAYGQHLQGKQMLVEALVTKYKLNIGDQAGLRNYTDPKEMHVAAEKMAGDRARDAELAELKQARVPAQSFDNSQGNPQVAADEGGWLDRYNGGDRSPSAQAAARKAAGLG
jgi:hypothetical protein